MKSSTVSFLCAAFLSCVAASAHAELIFIDFDDATNNADVGEFYNGGVDSAGNSGPNLGVEFINFQVLDGDSTGYGFSSPPNFIFGLDDSGPHGDGDNIINVANGFSSLSFAFNSPWDTDVFVYADLARTTELYHFPIEADFTTDFLLKTIPFTGIAHSVVFRGPSDAFGIDDISFGAVPEPATWMTMIAGFGLAGASLRARRRRRASSASFG